MMQSNFKFAITGGIGSGKSTVAEIIRRQNYVVLSCDEIYKELLQRPEFIEKLGREFNGVINPDGTLNRGALSEKVFADTVALEKLNSITHPAIMEEVLKKTEGYRLSFTEVPLLFENGFESYFDGVIVVLRNLEDRIVAVSKRDKIAAENVILRVKSQFNYENCNFAKYYVIHNDGNFKELERKTAEILEKINVACVIND
ncbi:MAG: dephospho-CoA kinase [Clostridia bacterium]|nr:dephospho-CoA kinase [Clostridia bacterium]